MTTFTERFGLSNEEIALNRAIIRQTGSSTNQITPAAIDAAFGDVSALDGSPEEIRDALLAMDATTDEEGNPAKRGLAPFIIAMWAAGQFEDNPSGREVLLPSQQYVYSTQDHEIVPADDPRVAAVMRQAQEKLGLARNADPALAKIINEHDRTARRR